MLIALFRISTLNFVKKITIFVYYKKQSPSKWITTSGVMMFEHEIVKNMYVFEKIM